jgi:putative effector of murein hydrolase
VDHIHLEVGTGRAVALSFGFIKARFMNPIEATNATKAAVAAAVNAGLAVASSFGLGTQEQLGAVGIFLNALFLVYLAFTYERSPKRIPEPEGS